jgi:hypothetical protein
VEYRPELADGAFHTAEGWIIFMLALLLLTLTHTVINRAYGAFGGNK